MKPVKAAGIIVMKKFLIALLILIIFSGGVFFIGWVQFGLEKDQYAVIYTKTGGYDKNITVPGIFSWRWEALLPTNMTMMKYTLIPYSTTIEAESALPSGDVYAEALGISAGFSYKIKFYLSCMIKPEFLPYLAENEKIEPGDLQKTYELFTAFCIETLQYKLIHSSSNEYFDPELPELTPNLEENLKSAISLEYPWMEIRKLTPLLVKVPDFALYRQVKEDYLKSLTTRVEEMTKFEVNISQKEYAEQKNISLLEEYGRIFNDYPALLEYLKIDENALKNLPKFYVLPE